MSHSQEIEIRWSCLIRRTASLSPLNLLYALEHDRQRTMSCTLKSQVSFRRLESVISFDQDCPSDARASVQQFGLHHCRTRIIRYERKPRAQPVILPALDALVGVGAHCADAALLRLSTPITIWTPIILLILDMNLCCVLYQHHGRVRYRDRRCLLSRRCS